MKGSNVRIAGCLAAVAVSLAPESAHAQSNAFLPSRGAVTVALSHTFEYYDEFWVGEMKVADPGVGRVETGSASVWLQAGLLDDLALVANFAYVDVRTNGAGGFQDQGLQDRTFLLRYRFANAASGNWRHTIVGAAGMRIPATGYDPNGPVALGDGTNDALARLVYQVQADRYGGTYLAVEAGVEARGGDAPNGNSLGAELGSTFSRLSLAANVASVWAADGSDIGEEGFTFPGLKEEFVRFGGTAYYRVSPEFGLALSGFTTVDGRNTGRSRGASTSLVVNL